jgi:hypothetical protein
MHLSDVVVCKYRRQDQSEELKSFEIFLGAYLETYPCDYGTIFAVAFNFVSKERQSNNCPS